MIRKFTIGLSIIFFALAGIITFNALGIPVKNTRYQSEPKKLKPKDLSPKSEDVLKKLTEEQTANRALVKELQATIVKLEDKLSQKNKKAQAINDKYNVQVRSDKNIDTKNTLNEKLNGNDQYASQLVYTVQIYSQKSIADAQKQFNSIVRSLGENLNLLRIEKVGKYYTVRFGKFENYANAKKFLQEIKPRLSEAIILKAYIKNERIIQLYE
jgi:hypothetical protein